MPQYEALLNAGCGGTSMGFRDLVSWQQRGIRGIMWKDEHEALWRNFHVSVTEHWLFPSSTRSNAMYTNAQYEPPGRSLPHQSRFEIGRSQLRIWEGSPKEICGIIRHYTRHMSPHCPHDWVTPHSIFKTCENQKILLKKTQTDRQTDRGGCVTTGQQMHSKHPRIDWHSELQLQRVRSVRPLHYLYLEVLVSKLIIYQHKAAWAARYDEYVSVPHLGS